MSIAAKRLAVALGVASIATAGTVGVAQQAASAAETSSQSQSQSRDRHRGPDISALAAKLGVSTAALKAAFDATRPAKPQGKGDRGAKLASVLATELGLSANTVQAALEKVMPRPPGKPPKGKTGSRPARPDESALAAKLAAALDIDQAKVAAALTKARAAAEADHAAREKAMATALADKLGLDAATVQSALQSLRPAGPPGPGR